VNTYKSCKILGSAGTHKTPAALSIRHLLKRKRDLNKQIKTKETANTNTTNPNQIEDSEHISETQTQHIMDTNPNTVHGKQIKLEVVNTTESTTSYDPELHSELPIEEKFSTENNPRISVQSNDDPVTTITSGSCSTSIPQSQPIEPIIDLIARKLCEGKIRITKDHQGVTHTTYSITHQTNTKPVTAPPTLRLRPIEQLLAASNVVESTSTTSTTSQTSQDAIGETNQQTVLEVDPAIDKLPQELQATVYQIQIEAEMRRRTACLAEQALKFEELVTIDFLRKFEHLQSDIMTSYRVVQEILVKHKNPITHIERIQYNQHKGFMFQKQLESRLARIEELKVVLDTPVPEYSDGTPIMHLTDTPCFHCKVGHKTSSTACTGTQLLTNMTKEQLRTDHTWRDKTKAVVISNKALVDLPSRLKDDVINIKVPRNLIYWADPNHTKPRDKTSKLYTEIMEILQLIGTENTYLVFIEFIRSHNNETALEYQHLAFVRTCRELQTNYGGLIIPVLGLHRPDKGETTAKYLESKYRLISCIGGAFATGRWLGIPVDLPNIQNGAPHRESQRKFSPPWRNEPLFNIDAEPTREWYRRITIYLMARICCFKLFYPMTNKHGHRIVLATPSYAAKDTAFP